MAKKSVLPNNVRKGTSHKESRPVWNNVRRINHQNKFAPTSIFTRSRRIPVSVAKLKVVASTSASKPVNTVGPKQSLNFSKSIITFHKLHSPIRRSFYIPTAHSRKNSTEKVNTAGSKAVSVVKGNAVTTAKTSAGCVWRPRVNEIDQISKDNRWICTRVDYGHPLQALKNKRIVDSGCSRHITWNKAYLADYQEINDGGFVVFGSSRDLDEFCGMKVIKREYVNAITPQQNKVVERKNMTLIEVGRSMLADSLLPITFWAEAINTACYVLNRALVTKSHNKTPYELLNGRTPRLDFMRPFGCPITILNILDPLGKFKGKADEGFLVGYSVTRKEVSNQHYIMLPLWSSISSTYKSSDDKAADDKPKDDTGSKTVEEPVNKEDQAYRDELDRLISQEKEASDAADSLRKDNPVNAASTLGTFSAGGPSSPYPDAFIPANSLLYVDQNDSQIPDLEDTAELRSTGIFNSAYDDDLDIFTSPVQSMGAEADFNNMESSIVIRIDYDEVFAPVARIEAIMIFLAFVPFMGFIVYQMDVKNAFLYGTIEEEVYISEPPSFIDPQFLNKVYKVEKALYGLHQAPRAWYETLSTSLLQNRYRKGKIDKTLCIKKNKDDIMLVQVYVDDIIFGSTKKSVKQSEEGIFISQDKYVAEILKKFDFSFVKTASTPIETQKPLVKDEEVVDVDVYLYRSMIGFLMYLTASRPDIMFVVCACSRFHVTPKLSHLHDVKQIFRYLKGQPKLGLWYPRDSLFNLECKKQTIVATSTTEAEYVGVANCCRQATLNEPTPQGEGSGSGHGRQETIEGAMAQQVTQLEEKEIDSLKKRVTKLEQIQCSRILGFHPFRASTSKRHSFDEDADTEMIVEDKGNGEKGGSTAKAVSTARPDISSASLEVSTAEPKTPPTTATLFDDEDVTIADTLDSKAALAEMYDEVQTQIYVDHELPVRLTHEEQEKYIVEERSKLLAGLLERRKKQLAKERVVAIRSKPPIKTQLGNLMITYLKHTCRFTHTQLKRSKEDENKIRSRKKREAGSSSKHKSHKKQKVNDQESEDNDKEHRKCLKVVLDDDKAIDYETLDVKSPIIDCKSQVLGTNKAGDVHVYKLTRLDGSYRHFSTFSRMLEVLDRQDVLDLHKIIMERFLANDSEGYDLILWGDLKTLVESSKDDEI
nr:retrovirus-related Pol polyprotein from transposon TNT 1-94 [Tanacetum cinerariifolium]